MPDLVFLIEPAPKGGNISTDVKDLAQKNIGLVIESLTSVGMVQ